ncbi:hypothetical protein ACFQX7_11420 [Luedemannella flava]
MPDGRPASQADATAREVVEGINRVSVRDFGDRQIIGVHSEGDVVHVMTRYAGDHTFRVEVGHDMTNVAETTRSVDPANEPHVIRVSDRIDAAELGRVWVNSITETMHEHAAAAHRPTQEGVVRRAMDRLSRMLGVEQATRPPMPEGRPDVNARLNERNLLLRELRQEPVHAEREQLRRDIAGVDRDLARLGHPTERLEPVPHEDRTLGRDANVIGRRTYSPHESVTVHEPAAAREQHPVEASRERDVSTHDEIWSDPPWHHEGRRPSMDELIPSNQREADAWRDTIRAEVARLFDGREFAGVRLHLDLAREHSISVDANSITIRVDISHPESGHSYNVITYRFFRGHDGQLIADHVGFRVPDALQGRGFATRFNEYVEAWYVESGLRHIEIHASLSVGGYAWARAGFDWAPGSQHRADAVMSAVRREMAALREDIASVNDLTADIGRLAERYQTTDRSVIADRLAHEYAAGEDLLSRSRLRIEDPASRGPSRSPTPAGTVSTRAPARGSASVC